MKKKVSYELIDTTYIPEYEEYVENCEINDREPDEEGSEDYWDFVYETQQENYDCEISNLKWSDDYKHRCVITGAMGLWWGRPTIKPVLCENVVKAIKKCFGSCDDLRVKFEDGVYVVHALHHDGTNCFEIHKLSKKGEAVAKKWDNGETLDEVKPHWFAKFKGV